MDEHAEGLVDEAGGTGQIGGELVRAFADHPGRAKRGGHPVQQVRGAEQFEGGGAGGWSRDDGGMAGGFAGGGGGVALVPEGFQSEQKPAEVALQQVPGQGRFLAAPLDEAAALAVAAEIEGIEVEKPVRPGEPKGDPEGLGRGVPVKTGDTVKAVAQRELPGIAAFLRDRDGWVAGRRAT